jgi:hypothetical protein
MNLPKFAGKYWNAKDQLCQYLFQDSVEGDELKVEQDDDGDEDGDEDEDEDDDQVVEDTVL